MAKTKAASTHTPQFIVDARGRKTGVVIHLAEYQRLVERVEDLEDACDLLRAERRARGFVPCEEFRRRFVKKA